MGEVREALFAAAGAAVSILGASLVSGIGRLIADEFKAWVPKITNRAIESSVRHLPLPLRCRHEEIWRCRIAKCPAELSQLSVALCLFPTAITIRLRHALYEKREQIYRIYVIARQSSRPVSKAALVICLMAITSSKAIEDVGFGPHISFNDIDMTTTTDRLFALGRNLRGYRSPEEQSLQKLDSGKYIYNSTTELNFPARPSNDERNKLLSQTIAWNTAFGPILIRIGAALPEKHVGKRTELYSGAGTRF